RLHSHRPTVFTRGVPTYAPLPDPSPLRGEGDLRPPAGEGDLRPSPRPSPLRGEGDLADFHDYGFAFAYAAASCAQAVVRARVACRLAAPPQLVHQGHDHPRRGGAGRVAEGDRAAVHVRLRADLL